MKVRLTYNQAHGNQKASAISEHMKHHEHLLTGEYCLCRFTAAYRIDISSFRLHLSSDIHCISGTLRQHPWAGPVCFTNHRHQLDLGVYGLQETSMSSALGGFEPGRHMTVSHSRILR